MLLPLPSWGKPSVRSPCAYLLIKFYNFYLFFVLYFQQSLCSLCSSWPGTIPRPRGLPWRAGPGTEASGPLLGAQGGSFWGWGGQDPSLLCHLCPGQNRALPQAGSATNPTDL